MAGAGGWRLWASSFRVLNRRAAARAMRPSGTARRMSRGTNEDLLADCITHRPPQQLLPTSLRCLPAKGRRILAHGLACNLPPTDPPVSFLPRPPFLALGEGRRRQGARDEDFGPSPKARKGGRGRKETGGGGELRTLAQRDKGGDQCSRSAIRRSGSSGSLP